jgi:DNA-binding SARP family transcriptional activator
VPRLIVRLFGSLDIRGPDDRPLSAVLAQPKRAAVLAYLAASPPGTFHRRDTLLALFWPELTERRARDALNSAVYFLRRSAGEGVVTGRGDDEIGVDPTVVWSDVAEFDRAVSAGRPEDALALYRGELLEGFGVADAPELEQWVARERARVKTAAVEAAWRASDSAASRGDEPGAISWARRAHDLAPDDEAGFRRLLEVFDRGGDAPAAIRAFESFTERLASVYELAPSQKTLDLVQTMRARHARGPERRAASAVETSAPATLPRAGSAKPRVWGIAATLVVLLVSAFAVARLRGERGDAATSPPAAAGPLAIAIFPFTVEGETKGYLGEGIAQLLGTTLDGLPQVRVVTPRAIAGGRASASRSDLSPDAARALAARLDAPLYVLGRVSESGGRLTVRLTLFDRRRGDAPIAQLPFDGGADALGAAVDSLALRVLASLPSTPGDRLTRVAALTTPSLPALRAYLEGEAEFRRGRFGESIDAFRQAVTADSTFAMAWYRFSNALTWSRGTASIRPDTLAARAVRHIARLPEREQFIVRGWFAYLTGNAVAAEERYREVLTTRPDDVEAWFYLGEVLYHWGPMYGRPSSEAREPFERVLEYEPDNAGALSHLVRLAAAAGELPAMRTYIARLVELHPDTAEVLDATALARFASPDSSVWMAFVDSVTRRSSRDARRILGVVAANANNPASTAWLAARVARPPYDPFSQRNARLLLAELETARGRPSAAAAALVSDDVLNIARSIEYRAAIATLPFSTTPPDTLAALARAVSAVPVPDSGVGPDQYSLPKPAIYPPRRLLLLGLLGIRRGDVATGTRYADSLDAFPGHTTRDELYARDFSRLLRAEVLAARGKHADALQALGAPGVESDSNLTEITSYPKAHERFLRAELLHTLNRDDEALRWYATFPDPAGTDLMYLGAALRRRGEIAESRRDTASAVTAYRRVLDLLRDAEPTHRGPVADLTARLQRLDRRG